jgi:hypothetical protein
LKENIKNILVITIIIAIISGSYGIEFFRHICYSHNFNSVSLLETPNCGNDNYVEATGDCCQVEEVVVGESSCCEFDTKPQSKNEVQFSNYEECCISFSKINKIDDLLYPPTEIKLTPSLKTFIILKEIEISEKYSERIVNHQNNDLPPPDFGRELLTLIHQLKIDTPIC